MCPLVRTFRSNTHANLMDTDTCDQDPCKTTGTQFDRNIQFKTVAEAHLAFLRVQYSTTLTLTERVDLQKRYLEQLLKLAEAERPPSICESLASSRLRTVGI